MLDAKIAAWKELQAKMETLTPEVAQGKDEARKTAYEALEGYVAECGGNYCIKQTLKPLYDLMARGDTPLAKEYAKKEAAYWGIAELDSKYSGRRITPEVAREAEADYRKAISSFALEGAAKQKALLELSIIFFKAQDRAHAEELQREGVLAAPDTPEVKMLYRDLGMDK